MTDKQQNHGKATIGAPAEDPQRMTGRQRRTYTTLGVCACVAILLIIVAAFFGLSRGGKENDDPGKAEHVPAFAGSDGAIVITKHGVVQDGKKYDGRTKDGIVRDYQDFLCPGCGTVNRELGGPFRQYMDEGKMVLKQYPISILDRLSDNTEYSTRTAAMAYRVAELDPEHYLDWVDVMFSKKVQPDESNFKPVSDSELQDLAVKAGLSRDDAKKATDGKYRDYVKSVTAKALKNESLWRADETGKRQFMTPILFVNDTDVMAAENEDMGVYTAKLLGVTQAPDGDGTSAVQQTK